MHDATEGGHKKSSKTANAATRVILLVESSYAQLPWAQQCQKTIGSIIDYLERSAGQGCLITYAAAHQDVPVTSSGWVRDMPALRELAEGICFTGSGQAAACGTALAEALAEAIYLSRIPAPNSPPPPAPGDVERKGKPLIHTHLLLLPSAAAPSLAPLPWPVQDQTTAARATSGYYDTIQATLQALQGGSSSSSSGSSRRKDGASTVTLLQKRDTAHALPGMVDVADLLLSLTHYGLSLSQFLPLANSSKVPAATDPYILAHATDGALYLTSAMKTVVPLNEGMLLLSPFAAPLLGNQVWPQEVAAVVRKRNAAAAAAAAAAASAAEGQPEGQRPAKQQRLAGPAAAGQQAGGASQAPGGAAGAVPGAPRQSTPPPSAAAAAAAAAAAGMLGRGSTPPAMLPPAAALPAAPAASAGMVAGPVGVHSSARLSPPPVAIAAAAGGVPLQVQGSVAVAAAVQQAAPWASHGGGAQLLQHAGNGLGAAAVSFAHPQQLGGGVGLPGGDPFAVDAAAAAAAAAAARAISPASVSPPPGLLGLAPGAAAGPSTAGGANGAAWAAGGELVGAGSSAAAASSLIHFPHVVWRGTLGYSKNGAVVALFEGELCVQQVGWPAASFWAGLPSVLVCSKFLSSEMLRQLLREHKARGHKLMALRYQATKLLPFAQNMEASIRKSENGMVVLAGSLGSGVSLYVCLGSECKLKPGASGAFNLHSNMVILIMPGAEAGNQGLAGSSAAAPGAAAGAAMQKPG